MAATIELDELNTVGITTHGVTNLNTGNIDAPNVIVSPTTAILAGTNAYVKYNQVHFTDLAEASIISGVRIWMSSGATVYGESVVSNLTTTGYTAASFAAPTTTKLIAAPMPTTDPGSANLGIAGSLTGTLTTAGTTDIWRWQVQTAPYITSGALQTKEYTVAWEEA